MARGAGSGLHGVQATQHLVAELGKSVSGRVGREAGRREGRGGGGFNATSPLRRRARSSLITDCPSMDAGCIREKEGRQGRATGKRRVIRERGWQQPRRGKVTLVTATPPAAAQDTNRAVIPRPALPYRREELDDGGAGCLLWSDGPQFALQRGSIHRHEGGERGAVKGRGSGSEAILDFFTENEVGRTSFPPGPPRQETKLKRHVRHQLCTEVYPTHAVTRASCGVPRARPRGGGRRSYAGTLK